MHRYLLASSLGLFSLAFLLSASAAQPNEQSANDLTAPYETRDPGQTLYVRQGCYQCHGLAGQGSIMSGPSLLPLRIDSMAFSSYVRNPKGNMPPYTTNSLSDSDLGKIENFIRSLPRPRPYQSIPALARLGSPSVRPAGGAALPDGRALYEHNCAACHGVAREGGIAPPLVDEHERRDASAVIALIVNPPSGMPKLSPDPLGDREVEAIARFVTTPAAP